MRNIPTLTGIFIGMALALWLPLAMARTSSKIAQLLEDGRNAYHASDYPEALAKLEEGLRLAREDVDQGMTGELLSTIGVVHEALGLYKKALEYHEQALAIKKASGDRSGQGKDLCNIGGVHLDLGRHEEALQYLQQALVLDRELGNREGEGADLSNIGLVYESLGEYQKALEYFEQALAIKMERNDPRGKGIDLTRIGIVYDDLGQYDKALKYYEQALEIDKETGCPRGEARNLTNIGGVYASLGRYDKALEYYGQALAIYKEIGDPKGEGTNLNNIGIVYFYVGQYERALPYYEQALAIKKDIGDRRGEGNNLSNIGLVYRNLGKNEEALQYYEQSFAIRTEIKDRRGQGADLSNIGIVYQELGQNDRALQYHLKALAMRREIGDRRGEGNDFINLGDTYQELGKYEEAHQAMTEGLKIYTELPVPDLLWLAQEGLAQAEVSLGMPMEALGHFEQALNSIESIRIEVGERESRTSFMRGKLQAYDGMIELLKMLHLKSPLDGHDRKALEILERKQGRALLEDIGRSGARSFAGIGSEIGARETELADRLEDVQSELGTERAQPAKGRNVARIRELESSIMEVRDAQKSLEEEIKVHHPDYYSLKYPRPAPLPQIQEEVLQSDEAMLIYGVMKKEAYLWTVGKNDFSFDVLDLSEEALTEKITDFRAACSESILSLFDKTRVNLFHVDEKVRETLPRVVARGKVLHDLLLPKQARRILSRAHTVYIIPAGPLYKLPFEALCASSDPGNPHYFIEDHAVAYLSSASLLKIIRESRARRSKKAVWPLIAFANPVYETPEAQASTYPSARPQLKNEPAPLEESYSLSAMQAKAYLNLLGGSLTPLPETEDEAREIKAILEAPDTSHPLQLHLNASRSNVLKLNREERLDNYRYVLFWTLDKAIAYPNATNLVSSVAIGLFDGVRVLVASGGALRPPF